jgi:hypothetical protein
MTSNHGLVLTSYQLGATQDMDKTVLIRPKQGDLPKTEILIEPARPVIAGGRFRRGAGGSAGGGTGGGSVGGTGSGAGGGGSAGGGMLVPWFCCIHESHRLTLTLQVLAEVQVCGSSVHAFALIESLTHHTTVGGTGGSLDGGGNFNILNFTMFIN